MNQVTFKDECWCLSFADSGN